MTESLIATHCVACGGASLSRTSAVLMPFVAHRALGWAPEVIDASWGLATIPSGMAFSRVTTLQCQQCATVFLDLRFGDREMTELYRDYRGEDYVRLRDQYEPGYAQRNESFESASPALPDAERFLRPWLPDVPAVLDWGGDNGINMPFRDTARVRDVFEISSVATLPGVRAVGRDALQDEDYDLVVLSHVLEHVPFPVALVAEVASVMHRNSTLYIEVPHERLFWDAADTSPAGQRKRHWHEHINFFTPEGLTAVVRSAGLHVIAEESSQIPGLAAGAVLRVAARLTASGS